MHDFLDTADDVIALKVSHTITGEDLEAIMDRLEAVMERKETVHVFVETHAIDGIHLSSLPAYTARALPLFGKLRRFGRVAVVADQAWIRFGTHLESMVLPFISYKVFEPEHRDEALAWVEGRAADTD